MTPVDQVLRFLGEVVVYGGGSAAVAFLLFQYLGKGWIDARFAERLEAFKHDQAKELQRLKVEVESLLSGALKMQEREFTVLPEAWKKLDDAHSLVQWVAAPYQQYPDLERINDNELEEFLSSSELLDSQKTRIRNSERSGRNETYQEIIFWHRLHRAKKAVADLQTYTASHGLFLPPELKQQFKEMHPILWSAISGMQIGQEARDYKMRTKAWDDLKAKGDPLHSAIEVAIEERLHSHGRTKTDA
jgi:hypothetical protein